MKRRNNKSVYFLLISTFVILTISLNCKTSDKLRKSSVKVIDLGINSITDDSLKLFVSNFELKQFPFDLTYIPQESTQEKQIEECYVNKFVKSKDHFDGIINRYYYGFVIFNEGYLLLITSFHQTQGLSSMEDWHLRIHSFIYDGTLISTKDIACHCTSLSIGRNEYRATSFNKVSFSDSLITTSEIKKHGNILPDEEENPFEEITRDTLYYSISKKGMIEKIVNE